ncbi:hypothetical protein [Sporichthya sp.]|uniref:hypothetical protein n=1 Tax=Sporichthya sp. TaxID=65475 RepID=UPI0017AF8812|nr:hypothetical protein [Sporichthya sp.]MBA3745674.1 hypothetical protein [Sporichthya sp.]
MPAPVRHPRPGAVTVIGLDGREVLHTRADDAGEFTIGVPPGRYFVVATDAGRSDHVGRPPAGVGAG